MENDLSEAPYSNLAERADQSIAAMSRLIAPLWVSDKLDTKNSKVLATLSTTCLSSTGSALSLVETGRVWDAAILQRSVLEGSIRFIYLLHGEGEFDERFREFAEILEEIAWLRLNVRVKAFLDILEEETLDAGSRRTLDSLTLGETETKALAAKYPSRQRRVYEDKWSFSKLLRYLVAKNVLPAAAAADFQLRYLKSSQSIHGNPLGLASFYERAHRPEPNCSSASYAHAAEVAKVLKDLTLYRTFAAHLFIGRTMEELLSAYKDDEFDALCSSIFKTHHQLEYGSDLNQN